MSNDNRAGPPTAPMTSLLTSSALSRVAGALGLSMLLWLCVAWALG